MEYTKHISVTELDGHSVITVHDYELFDYLDDFFTEEQDINITFITKEVGEDGSELRSLHFASQYTPQTLISLLSQIPIAEIERIHSLNNHKN